MASYSRVWWILAAAASVACSNGTREEEAPLAKLRYSTSIPLSEVRGDAPLVAVADANGDGWLDVLSWGNSAPAVAIAVPNYGLSSPRKIAGLPTDQPRQVVWADFDGDRHADVVIIDADGVLRRYDSGSVDEYVEVPLELPEIGPLAAFVLLDFNRDGRLDYVLLEESRSADGGESLAVVHVVRGGKDNTLERVQTLELLPAEGGAAQATAFLQPADVDGDGDWDVVVAAPGVGLGVFLYGEDTAHVQDAGVTELADAGGVEEPPSSGPYSYRPWAEVSDVETVEDTTAIVLRDFDFDGEVDAILFGEELTLHRGDESGGFHGADVSGLVGGTMGCVDDFNNDGRLDLLSISDELVVRLGNSKGGFSKGVDLDVKDVVPVSSVVCADLDNDGDVDIVTIGKRGTRVHLNRLEPVEVRDASYLDFQLVGRGGNAPAFGTVVELQTGKRTQRREFVGSGQARQPSSPVLHFGLGTDFVVDEVRVTWPQGTTRKDTEWVAFDSVTAIQPKQ